MRTDDLLVSQPDCGEQALEITEMLVRSGAVDVIVVDSVAAPTPRAELEGEHGRLRIVGLQARPHEPGALRKLTGTIAKSKHALVIFGINQIRMKIGVMFGNPGDDDRGQRAQVLRQRPAHDIRRVGAPGQGRRERSWATARASRS